MPTSTFAAGGSAFRAAGTSFPFRSFSCIWNQYTPSAGAA